MKSQSIPKGRVTQFEDAEQASESDVARMLERTNQGFKTTMANLLKALMDRVDSMQEQTDRNPKNQKIKARNKFKKNRNEEWLSRAY